MTDDEKVCRNCKWFNMDGYGATGWGDCDNPDVHERSGENAWGFVGHDETFGCRFFKPKEKN